MDTPSPYRTSSYTLTIRQIPTRPNKTITPRSTGAGSRLPTLAPIDPPTSDPAAINPAASQLTRSYATSTYADAATALTTNASRFFSALRRWSDYGSSELSTPTSRIP